MGADHLAFNPSLRSLTHALGLDDDSVEEVLSPSLLMSKSTGRPPSIASSVGGYNRSASMPHSPDRTRSTYRSPYMSTKTSPQDLEKKASDTDLRHLSCLQYCQVTGSNACPSDAVTSEKLYDSSCDDLSMNSSQSNFNLQRSSTLRSRSVYLEPTQRHARNKSSCSLLKLSSKVLPFGSRKNDSTPSKLAWPHVIPDITIKDNAAYAAINVGLSGMPFADLILVSATDGLETHVHSYILSSVCPLLLQKIGADDTLDLDIGRTRQSSISSSSQMKPSSRRKWTHPKSWWRGDAKTLKKPADKSSRSGKIKTDSIASESTLSVDILPRPYESSYCTRPRRVQVTGCNGADLRAFCFYLYTNQFRLVSSHGVEGVDDSSAFRGHAKGSSSTSASDSDETAWDPIRIRKSRSLHDVLWPEKDAAGLRARRSSTHTLLSLNSTGATSPFASSGALRPVQDGTFQHSASQAPPFSVQGAYHLSQLFNLTHLACASSSFFFHRLTLTNALQYYISPFSIAYPLIQSGCLDYLVRHWAHVSTQTQSQTILGRLAAGWYPQANMALLQLLGKIE